VTHIGAKKDFSAVINAALAGARNAAHLEYAVGDMYALTHRWEKGLITAGCTTALATYKKLHEDRPTAGWLVLLKFCLASALYCAAPAALQVQQGRTCCIGGLLQASVRCNTCCRLCFMLLQLHFFAEEGFTADNMPVIEETYYYSVCSALL
jgi:hypothetical protein